MFSYDNENPVLKELNNSLDRKIASLKDIEGDEIQISEGEKGVLPFLMKSEIEASDIMEKYLLQLLLYSDIESEKSNTDPAKVVMNSNDDVLSVNESQLQDAKLDPRIDLELDEMIPDVCKTGSNKQLLLQQISFHSHNLNLINRKLNKTIMDNYNEFMHAMTEIQGVGVEVTKNSVLCSNARVMLKQLKENRVKSALSVLETSKFHKRTIALCSQLKRISQILHECNNIESFLDKRDFPNAISTLIKCGNLLHGDPILIKINALKSLSISLEKRWEEITDRIYSSLKHNCTRFNPSLYEKILIGVRLLDNNQLQAKFLEYFTESVSQSLKKIAQSYAFKRAQFQVENLSKLNFNELCQYIHSEDTLSCCLQVFSVLSDLLYNYNSIYLWHRKLEAQKALISKDIENKPKNTESPSIYDFDYSGEFKFFSTFRRKLWEIIQNMLSSFLASVKFSDFKPDRFLQVNHGVSLICILGQKFSGVKPIQLWKTLSDQTKKYFLRHHRVEVLENLRIVLSFEKCQRLDINPQLTEMKISKRDWSSVHEHIKQVKEFLPTISNNDTVDANLDIIGIDKVHNVFREASSAGQFDIFSLEKSDFVSTLDNYKEEESDDSDKDYEDASDEKISSFFLQPTSDSKKPRQKKIESTYTVLNSTHAVLKQVPFYLHAIQVFEAQRGELFQCLISVFYLYLYTAQSIFANFSPKEHILPENDPNLSSELVDVFSSIRKILDRYNAQIDNNSPFPTPILEQSENLFHSSNGIILRSNMAESLIFLRDLVEHLAPQLKQLLPKNIIEKVDDFVRTFTFAAGTIRRLIYDRLVTTSLNMESYPGKISSCKFVVTMLRESNPYVQSFLLDMKRYFDSISHIEDKLPPGAIKELWSSATMQLMSCMVEGFSKVKKCNNEGRALMQLDFNALQGGLTEISNYEISGLHKVKNYIQGYYLQENDILEWVNSVKNDYTYKQIESLINLGCGANMKKKAKTELLKMVEGIVGKEKNQASWITHLGFRK